MPAFSPPSSPISLPSFHSFLSTTSPTTGRHPHIIYPFPICIGRAYQSMCVIFWTINDPNYDLVIASNRDEFLSRPTLSASWHDFSSSSSSSSSADVSETFRVLSARDATGGGTWLGITRNGAFATLTNFTEQSAPLPAGIDAFESRGKLVRDWLVGQADAEKGKQRGLGEVQGDIETYLTGAARKGDRFAGFNLLVGAISEEGGAVGYITNRNADGGVVKDRKPEIFLPRSFTNTEDADAAGSKGCLSRASPTGMSNSILTQPWSKVISGSSLFQSALLQHQRHLSSPDQQSSLIESLFDLLWTSSDPKPAARAELRNSVLISPLELPATAEGTKRDWYATRTSTVILVGKDGKAVLVERDTFKADEGEVDLINGPERSGASKGRSGGQRTFEWIIR
ncbi:uncharacterized protein UTRI_05205 [Ustilago trichophora]|uniref:Uncharacterized protein n=1 Tax=Ustilago trichophora TaxID=86804 RepID=A0A5C3EJ44_9BASI|nr:uncharacterized protein UTRI_05205 [Ustilago trichophora]